MSKAAEITVYMVIGAVVLCCILVVVPVAHVTIWYPDRVLPEKTLGLASTAFTVLSSIGMALVINVLSTSKQPAAK